MNISPSEQCKVSGLKSLSELSKLSGVCPRTLINWHKDKPRVFETILAGAVVIKNINEREKEEL